MSFARRLWPLGLLYAAAQAVAAAPAEPLQLLGTTVAPASMRALKLRAGESFAGDALTTPVLVAHGADSGPTVCLTAAIHGDELNGIEVVRRVLHGINPAALKGTVIGVPVVNLLGFTQGSRNTPDRRDLNRFFPGRPTGNYANRLAYQLFSQLIEPNCTYLIDLHTGSFKRANLPQLRADLADPAVRRLAASFGATPILRRRGSARMLRRVASERGIPSVSLEFGEATTVQPQYVDKAVAALRVALGQLGLLAPLEAAQLPQLVYARPFWIRAPQGGVFMSRKVLGDSVVKGEIVGTIVNPLTDAHLDITAPDDGFILGLASDQFVLPGYGVYDVGRPVEGTPEKASKVPGPGTLE